MISLNKKLTLNLFKGLLLLIFINSASTLSAQRYYVEDPDFRDWLMNIKGIPFYGPASDTIDAKDLTAYKTLLIGPASSYVKTLAGIEAFKNLDSLIIKFYVESISSPLPSNLKYIEINTGAGSVSLTNLPMLQSVLCNNVDSIMQLSNNLQYLQLQYVKYVKSFPKKIDIMDLSVSYLPTLPDLPDTVLYLTLIQGPFSFKNKFTHWPAGLISIQWDGHQNKTLPNFPSTLKTISITHGLLEECPTLPDGLEYLVISDNQLKCLPVLPLSIQDLSFDGNQISCIPNYISTVSSSPDLSTLPICNASSGCDLGYNIYGKVFLDGNSDCALQGGEDRINGVKVLLFDSISQPLASTFSNRLGQYSFKTNNGKYKVKIDTTNLSFNDACGLKNITVSASKSIDTTVNLGTTCKSGFDIGLKSINNYNPLRPGRTTELYIEAGDLLKANGANSCSSANGDVLVHIIGKSKYTGIISGAITPTYSSSLGDTVIWKNLDFKNINIATALGIKVYTDTTSKSGDLVYVDVYTTPESGDLNQTNNHQGQYFKVVNSYDPNFKEVSPPDTFGTNDSWLLYTIHFQNTGNAEAINIKIIDTLDQNLL
ncbi:MAG: hypothetical protein HYZ42_14795, partial [Bacteroidetes bacterium]|nr:hypothetical protein [Bacteroidota bacterium]